MVERSLWGLHSGYLQQKETLNVINVHLADTHTVVKQGKVYTLILYFYNASEKPGANVYDAHRYWLHSKNMYRM